MPEAATAGVVLLFLRSTPIYRPSLHRGAVAALLCFLQSAPSLAADAAVEVESDVAVESELDHVGTSEPTDESNDSSASDVSSTARLAGDTSTSDLRLPSANFDGFKLTEAVELPQATGLRVVAQLIDDAPEVVVCTAVLAGAVEDPSSAPGSQRLIAEILKDGGYRSAAADYKSLVKERGGHNDVRVYADGTVFCTTLPSSELELALWVAASRFSASAFTEQNLASAVSVLSLEAEQRDAAVYEGRAPVRLQKMAFLGQPALGHSALSSPEELEAITLEQLRATHATSYVAQRSVVSIVGGGELSSLKTYLEKYLQRMHAGTELTPALFELVAQKTTRFSMDEDRAAKTPAAWYGWVVEQPKDQAAARAALSILVGKTRLAKTLVSGAAPATRLRLHYSPTASSLPSLARLEVVGRSSHSLGLIEHELTTQARLLASSGPTQAELEVYQKALLEEQRASLTTNLGRSVELGIGVLRGRTVSAILAPLSDEYRPDVSEAEQIRGIASRVLVESRLNIVEVYPKGWQDPWQSPMPAFHIVEKGQTLGSIAAFHGTDVATITRMNHIGKDKPIYPGDKLKVPRGKRSAAKPARNYQVKRGDTLSGIAHKYSLHVRDIASANGMGSRQTIRIGETLTIPWASPGVKKENSKSSSSPTTSEKPEASLKIHTVSAGETFSGIAHKYRVSSVSLGRANGISQKSMVKIGQTLKIPPAEGTESVPQLIVYRVKSGDTLSGIAKKHGVSVAQITAANQMSRDSKIRPGQTINIPK